MSVTRRKHKDIFLHVSTAAIFAVCVKRPDGCIYAQPVCSVTIFPCTYCELVPRPCFVVRGARKPQHSNVVLSHLLAHFISNLAR